MKKRFSSKRTAPLAESASGAAAGVSSSAISRRQLIKGGAAVAAASAATLALAGCGSSAGASSSPPPEADIIVIGGGFSGLSAAQAIVAGGKSVLVLEAQDRVGGRIWTEPVTGYPNAWIDMGGQWVGYNGSGAGQTYVEAVINQLGLSVFPTWGTGVNQGYNQIFYGGQSAIFTGDDFASAEGILGPGSAEDFAQALTSLGTMAATVNVDNPALTPNAVVWDSQTFQTWMNANMTTAGGMFLMSIAVAGYIGTVSQDFSLLHFLFYIAAGGGITSLHTYGLQYRVTGGTQQIANDLASQLGNRVFLNTRVEEIDQPDTGPGVVVKTNNGNYQGKLAIVAIPPTLAGRIFYNPQVTCNRDGFTQRAPVAVSIKCHAVYPTPFWRQASPNPFSGVVYSDLSPVKTVQDNSPPGNNPTPGILVAFIGGTDARVFSDQSPDAVQAAVLANLTTYFGPQASNPLQFFQANWIGEPFSRGCFAAYLPPGVWTGYPEALRTPVGKIHWAGTETSTTWYAYMNGAIAAGQRAAAEVLAAL
ncbi:MAG: flavin monoamine oxidase family protein [Candidatus Binataceae bacterium]